MPEIEAGRDMATLEVKRKVGVFKVKGNGKGKPRDTRFLKRSNHGPLVADLLLPGTVSLTWECPWEVGSQRSVIHPLHNPTAVGA